MSFYNQLAIVIFLVSVSLLFSILFFYIQNKIGIFWQQKFKPDFFIFPLANATITKTEMEEIHLLYQYLAIASSFFAMFFILFVCELIELLRSYKKRNLASAAA
jgi:hypothetical protein